MPIDADTRSPLTRAAATRSTYPWYLAVAMLGGLGLLGKVSLLAKVSHVPRPAVLLAACAFPLLPLLWPFALRFRHVVGSLALLTLLASSVVLYPRMDALHKLGRGSDQAECVVLAANRLAHHQWPYVASLMSSRNAMSCGPGWVALQIPAISLLGYRWDLALCWLLCTAILTLHLGWSRTSAILALIALSGGTWLSAGNGCDFLTFGIVLATLAVALDSPAVAASPARRWLLALLLGFVVQFRTVTLPVPAFFSRRLGRATAIAAWAFATACQLAFLLWNPDAFVNQGPLHIAQKLLRTSVLSTHPLASAAEFLLASALGLAVCFALTRLARRPQPLLIFLSAVFVLPAFQNFLLRYHQFGSILRAFEFWEGGVWITAILPLAAALLTLAQFPLAQTAPADLPRAEGDFPVLVTGEAAA